MKTTIDEQISEVQREIALRRNVYPRLIGQNKLRKAEAEESMRRINGALDTLIWVRDHRAMLVKLGKERGVAK